VRLNLARRRPPRRGAAAVEMAVLLPLLMLIVLGCVDFGRFAVRYITTTNGARAGAGYGCVNPYTTATYATWQANVRQAVADEMGTTEGFTSGNVTAEAIDEGGGLWRAEVTVPCRFQTLVRWPGIPSDITLRRTVKIRGIR
jgi:Flp pilus assembly protein TadG